MAACRMTKENYQHTSVLLDEVMTNLSIKEDGIYVDATFGRGGHTQAILEQLGPNGKIIAIDKDPEAVDFGKIFFAHDKRFSIYHGSFSLLETFLIKEDVLGKVDGILFDLGVSSPQLDDPRRGFSFQRDGKLDMRMDTTHEQDAAAWVANTSEKEIADVLWRFGEEKFSRRIAKAIVMEREFSPIDTTEKLSNIIAGAVPFRDKGKNPATRSFQAIRIVVNQELEDLKYGLQQAMDGLKKGGRLLVISFHSLEDRIVKHFVQDQELGDPLPHGLPVKFNVFKPKLKRVGKAIKPSQTEINKNPRARSAVLRIAEKQS